MTTKTVIIRDEKEWEIVRRVLDSLGQGGILIPPERCLYLDEQMPDWEDRLSEKGDLFYYDLDGPSVRIDIAEYGTNAANLLDEFLISTYDWDEDG